MSDAKRRRTDPERCLVSSKYTPAGRQRGWLGVSSRLSSLMPECWQHRVTGWVSRGWRPQLWRFDPRTCREGHQQARCTVRLVAHSQRRQQRQILCWSQMSTGNIVNGQGGVAVHEGVGDRDHELEANERAVRAIETGELLERARMLDVVPSPHCIVKHRITIAGVDCEKVRSSFPTRSLSDSSRQGLRRAHKPRPETPKARYDCTTRRQAACSASGRDTGRHARRPRKDEAAHHRSAIRQSSGHQGGRGRAVRAKTYWREDLRR